MKSLYRIHFTPFFIQELTQPNWEQPSLAFSFLAFLGDKISHTPHYFDTKNSRHVRFVYHHFNQCPHCKWCIIFCTRACFLAKAPVLRIQNQKCSPNSVVFVERKHGTTKKCRKHLRIFLHRHVVNSLMRFSFSLQPCYKTFFFSFFCSCFSIMWISPRMRNVCRCAPFLVLFCSFKQSLKWYILRFM